MKLFLLGVFGWFSELHEVAAEEQRRNLLLVSGNGPGISYTCPCTYFTSLVTFWAVNYDAHFTDEKTEAQPVTGLSLPFSHGELNIWPNTHALPHYLSGLEARTPLHATASELPLSPRMSPVSSVVSGQALALLPSWAAALCAQEANVCGEEEDEGTL